MESERRAKKIQARLRAKINGFMEDMKKEIENFDIASYDLISLKEPLQKRLKDLPFLELKVFFVIGTAQRIIKKEEGHKGPIINEIQELLGRVCDGEACSLHDVHHALVSLHYHGKIHRSSAFGGKEQYFII